VNIQLLKGLLRRSTIPFLAIIILTFLLTACEETALNIEHPQTEGQIGGGPLFNGVALFRPTWCPHHNGFDQPSAEWIMSKLPDRELLVAACEKPEDGYFKPQTIYLGYWRIPGCKHDLGLLEKPKLEGYVMLSDPYRPDTNYFTKCVREG